MRWDVVVMLSILSGGMAVSIYLIAADPKRFFVQFSLEGWNPRQYQAMLSNFLQAIHDEGLGVWPRKLNGVTAAWYRFRMRRIIGKRPSLKKAEFLRNHLNLAALLVMLKPFIDDQIMGLQVRVVVGRLIDMADTADRDKLTAFVERAEEVRKEFQRRLTPIDRQIQGRLWELDFLPTLTRLHAIFLEHGFCLLPELDGLRRWAEMEGSELVQELPELKIPRELPMWTGLVPGGGGV